MEDLILTGLVFIKLPSTSTSASASAFTFMLFSIFKTEILQCQAWIPWLKESGNQLARGPEISSWYSSSSILALPGQAWKAT